MKSKPDNNKAEEEYVFGYDSDFTLKFHTSRTAESDAFWFLPYLKPGMTLLDVGCASGSITVGLAKAVEPGQVNGVDVSAKEIERAKQRAVNDKLKNVLFAVGDAYQLDFPDNNFDALFSHNVLEHIPEPKKALKEFQRVLKPGGIIGIRDLDHGGLLTAPDNELIRKSIAIAEAYWKSLGGHPRIGRQLGGLLHGAGFVEIKMSASFHVFSDLERCRFWMQLANSFFTEPDFVKSVIENGSANAEELSAWVKAWQDWAEIPGAFHARSHCEAIGRKA